MTTALSPDCLVCAEVDGTVDVAGGDVYADDLVVALHRPPLDEHDVFARATCLSSRAGMRGDSPISTEPRPHRSESLCELYVRRPKVSAQAACTRPPSGTTLTTCMCTCCPVGRGRRPTWRGMRSTTGLARGESTELGQPNFARLCAVQCETKAR
jgi:hypothetical protein